MHFLPNRRSHNFLLLWNRGTSKDSFVIYNRGTVHQLYLNHLSNVQTVYFILTIKKNKRAIYSKKTQHTYTLFYIVFGALYIMYTCLSNSTRRFVSLINNTPLKTESTYWYSNPSLRYTGSAYSSLWLWNLGLWKQRYCGKTALKILQNNSQHKQNNSLMHGIWWTRKISS